MLVVPYAVDVPFDRRPVMNWLLVGSVIAAFGFQIADITSNDGNGYKVFVLEGWTLEGLFGHMWLHGGIIHLAGNMVFLWVFGNAVCAKLGNLLYLPVYLLFGLAGAVAHLIFKGGPMVGASGAINGVVGMFLIFFWQNEMDCLFLMFLFFRPIIKTFTVSSFWMIGLWLAFDIFGAVRGSGYVAYFAHLGGFVMGAILAIVLLKFRLVTMYRDEQSLLDAFDQWRQHRQDAKLERLARIAIEKAEKEPSPEFVAPKSPPKPAAKPASTLAMVRFTCPCGKVIKAPIQAAGKSGRCPTCRQKLTVPTPTQSAG